MTNETLQEAIELTNKISTLDQEIENLQDLTLYIEVRREVNHYPTLITTIGVGYLSEHSDAVEARAFITALIDRRKAVRTKLQDQLAAL